MYVYFWIESSGYLGNKNLQNKSVGFATFTHPREMANEVKRTPAVGSISIMYDGCILPCLMTATAYMYFLSQIRDASATTEWPPNRNTKAGQGAWYEWPWYEETCYILVQRQCKLLCEVLRNDSCIAWSMGGICSVAQPFIWFSCFSYLSSQNMKFLTASHSAVSNTLFI